MYSSDKESSLIDYMQAYWETERDAEERERKKRMDRVIKRWTRLIQGLRLRQRLQEQYGGSHASGELPNAVQHEANQDAKVSRYNVFRALTMISVV